MTDDAVKLSHVVQKLMEKVNELEQWRRHFQIAQGDTVSYAFATELASNLHKLELRVAALENKLK